MESVTKTVLSQDVVDRIVAETWGGRVRAITAKPLDGGFFNASLRLDLSDGDSCVLRVAPPPDVTVLRYERDLLFAETEALQLVSARTMLPVARVIRLDASCRFVPSPYLIVSLLPGSDLSKVRDAMPAPLVDTARHQIGGALTQLHEIVGPAFGYLTPGSVRYTRWAEAFGAMIGGVLDDGEAADVPLPLPYSRIRELLRLTEAALAAVTVPRFVHWDLWDGNVFVDPATGIVTGFIDFERSLWGDPLMEYQFRGHTRNTDGPPPGYGGPVDTSPAAAVRCLLYDSYLYSIMVIECTYRRFPTDDQHRWAYEQLTRALAALETADLG